MKLRKTKIRVTAILLVLLLLVTGVRTVAYAEDATPTVHAVLDYQDLRFALESAKDGDILMIMQVVKIGTSMEIGDTDCHLIINRSNENAYLDFTAGTSKLTNITFEGGGITSKYPFVQVAVESMQFSGCVFQNCGNPSYQGGTGAASGAVRINRGTVTFESCVFTKNSGSSGGHIAVCNESVAGLKDCTLTKGISGKGGAICVWSASGNCTIESCVITGNSSLDFGGGIANSGTVTIQGTKLYDNAANNGGADIGNTTTGTVQIQDSIEQLTELFEPDKIKPVAWVCDYDFQENMYIPDVDPNQENALLKLQYEVIPDEPEPTEPPSDDTGESGDTGDAEELPTPSEPSDPTDEPADPEEPSDTPTDDAEQPTDPDEGDTDTVEPSEPSGPGTGEADQSSDPSESVGDTVTDNSDSSVNTDNSDNSVSTDNSDNSVNTDNSNNSVTDNTNNSSTDNSSSDSSVTDNSQTDNSVSNNDESSSSNVNNTTVDNSSVDNSSVSNTTVDNSSVSNGNDSSTTTNTHNTTTTTNNYYTNESSQTPGQAVSQPIVIQVQNDSAATDKETTATEQVTDAGNTMPNIKIDAQGVDCVFEIVDGVYNISITARQPETISDTVIPVATYTPTTEEQPVVQSVDWLQVIQIVLLGAVLVCLIWKPKNQ